MSGYVLEYFDSAATIPARSITATGCPIYSSQWYFEPAVEPPKRSRIPFYRDLFDQRAPRVAVYQATTAAKPKWKPLMGKCQPCRD